MSFFYDLNKRLADLAKKTEQQQIAESKKAEAVAQSPLTKALNESAVAEAGYSAKAARAGKDIGKPGKAFAKIAKSAGERYGSKAAGERVAGAVLNKLRHPKEGIENEGNAFTGALAKTPKGGKFNVGGKEFTDTSSIEEEGGTPMTPKQKAFAKLAPPADKITFADKIAGAKKEVDEMLGDVAAEAMKAAIGKGKKVVADEDGIPSSTGGTIHKTPTGLRRVAGKNYGALDVSGDDEDDQDDRPRVKGRPKGSKRAIGAKVKGTSKLHRQPAIADEGWRGGLAGERPLVKTRKPAAGATPKQQAYNEIMDLLKASQSGIDPYIRNHLVKLVRQLTAEEPVAEKAVSKAQQKFMGMVHAIQKGEKVKGASPELKKTAKSMKKKDAEDFASTKHKGLPTKVKKTDEEKTSTEDNRAEKAGKKVTKDLEYDMKHKGKDDAKAEKAGKKVTKDIEYDDKKDRKEKKVDETTVAGSVATAPASGKSSKGMQFGKGVYESLDTQFKQALTESISIQETVAECGMEGSEPGITIQASGEDAMKLMQLLKLAGLDQQSAEPCPTCGEAPCNCAEMVDENSPDWPTNTEEGGHDDPNLRMYSGGLNKPKSTGQTTIPTLGSADIRRQVSMEESVELERSLFKLYKDYTAK